MASLGRVVVVVSGGAPECCRRARKREHNGQWLPVDTSILFPFIQLRPSDLPSYSYRRLSLVAVVVVLVVGCWRAHCCVHLGRGRRASPDLSISAARVAARANEAKMFRFDSIIAPG